MMALFITHSSIMYLSHMQNTLAISCNIQRPIRNVVILRAFSHYIKLPILSDTGYIFPNFNSTLALAFKISCPLKHVDFTWG